MSYPLLQRFYRIFRHKWHHTRRLSRKTVTLMLLLAGAAWVALVSLLFAKLADFAMEENLRLLQRYPWFAWVALPFGLVAVLWLTRTLAPFTSGSGIPQVIAALSLPEDGRKVRLIALLPTLLKIPLTFVVMLIGGSVGREGPSVQVGAAVMLSWGRLCKARGWGLSELKENDLIAAGAAGGLAAAFNAPLAGVVFAIEELGRGVLLRWERHILLGVLAAGFFLIAVSGNNPYFPHFQSRIVEYRFLALWVLGCGLVCGVCGGIFARVLLKGPAWVVPARWKARVRQHPYLLALVLGLMLAALGSLCGGHTYGTGYAIAAEGLSGNGTAVPHLAAGKWAATVLTYWTGVPGGIFTPCLSTGAALGASLHQVLALLQVGVPDMSILVILCMAAFLAAATQAPLTASVVVMEMTAAQPALFWLLVACLVASAVSRQFCPKPFYHTASARFRQRVQEEYAERRAEQAALDEIRAAERSRSV